MNSNKPPSSVDPKLSNVDRREFIRLAAAVAGYLTVDHSYAAVAAPLDNSALNLGNEALRVHVTAEQILQHESGVKNTLRAIDMLRRLQVDTDPLNTELGIFGDMSAKKVSQWTSRLVDVNSGGTDTRFQRWIMAARVAVLTNANEDLGPLLKTTGYVDGVARDVLRYGQQVVRYGPPQVRSRLREIARDPLGNLGLSFVSALPGFDPLAKEGDLLARASIVVQAFSRAQENFKTWSERGDKQVSEGVFDLLSSVIGDKNQALAAKIASGLALADRLKIGADFKATNLHFGDAVMVGLEAAGLLGLEPKRLEKIKHAAAMACQVASFAGYGSLVATGGGSMLAMGLSGIGVTSGGGPDPAIMAALAEIKRMLKNVIERLQRIETSIDTLHNRLENFEITTIQLLQGVGDAMASYAEEAVKARIDEKYKKMVEDQEVAIKQPSIDNASVAKWTTAFASIVDYCNTGGVNKRLPERYLVDEVDHLLRVKAEERMAGSPSGRGLLRGLDVLYQVPEYMHRIPHPWTSTPRPKSPGRPENSAHNPYLPLNPTMWAVGVDQFTRTVFALVERCTDTKTGITAIPPQILDAISSQLPGLRTSGEATKWLYNATGSPLVFSEAATRVSDYITDGEKRKNLWEPLARSVSSVLLPTKSASKPDKPLLDEISFSMLKDFTGGCAAPEPLPGAKARLVPGDWHYPRLSSEVDRRGRRLPGNSFFAVGVDKSEQSLLWSGYEAPVLANALTEGIVSRIALPSIVEAGLGAVRYSWQPGSRFEWKRRRVRLELSKEHAVIAHPDLEKLEAFVSELLTCTVWHYTHGRDDWYVAERDGVIVGLRPFFEEVARRYCDLCRRRAEMVLREKLANAFLDGALSSRFRSFVLDAAFANLVLVVWLWRHGAYLHAGGLVPGTLTDRDQMDFLEPLHAPVPFPLGHIGDIIFSPQEIVARIAKHAASLTYSTESAEAAMYKVEDRGVQAVERLIADIKSSLEAYISQFVGNEPKIAIPIPRDLDLAMLAQRSEPKTTIPPVEIGLAQIAAVQDLLGVGEKPANN